MANLFPCSSAVYAIEDVWGGGTLTLKDFSVVVKYSDVGVLSLLRFTNE
jgi:hypothetical protein